MARRLRIAVRMHSETPLRADGRNPGFAPAGSIHGCKTRRNASFAGGAFIIDHTPTGVWRMPGTVSNIAMLYEDMASANSASSGSFAITQSSDIVGKADPYAINLRNDVLPTVIGSGGANFDDSHRMERVNPDANRPIAEWRA